MWDLLRKVGEGATPWDEDWDGCCAMRDAGGYCRGRARRNFGGHLGQAVGVVTNLIGTQGRAWRPIASNFFADFGYSGADGCVGNGTPKAVDRPSGRL